MRSRRPLDRHRFGLATRLTFGRLTLARRLLSVPLVSLCSFPLSVSEANGIKPQTAFPNQIEADAYGTSPASRVNPPIPP